MYTMTESVAVAKEADVKKGVSPTKTGNSILRLRDVPERQLGSLRSVIGNITRNGGTPSVESIATELSSMSIGGRAPALLALQQTHGNQYVQRVVAGIQAKLTVGQSGDIYEQEADRVADEVVRMPESEVQRQAEEGEEQEEEILQTKTLADQITRLVQRQVEEEEKEEENLQIKEVLGQTPEVTLDLESRIQSLKGAGQSLPESARDFFEQRFGQDFSRVYVHSNPVAAEIALALNARAFTTGHDVVFGAGEYAPETVTGRKLLAHELTHVVQQRERGSARAQVQLSPDLEPEIRITSGIPRGVHDTRTAIYYARVRRTFRFYTRMANRELIQEAQRLDEFLRGPCADFGPEAQSEFAQLLIEMEEEMDHRLQQAEIGPNGLRIIEGISWDADDPLAGIVEAIPPFGMLDVWTTFVRHPPERPARRRPARSIEMEEEEITVPRIEMEEEEITVPTQGPVSRRPRRRLPLTRAECTVGSITSVRGILSGGRYYYGIHTTQHGTICYGRYDCETDTCSPRWLEWQGNVVYTVEYNEGIDDQRNGCVSRERHSTDAAYRAGVYCERTWGQARGEVRWGS